MVSLGALRSAWAPDWFVRRCESYRVYHISRGGWKGSLRGPRVFLGFFLRMDSRLRGGVRVPERKLLVAVALSSVNIPLERCSCKLTSTVALEKDEFMLVGGATWGSLFELGDVSRDSARAILSGPSSP